MERLTRSSGTRETQVVNLAQPGPGGPLLARGVFPAPLSCAMWTVPLALPQARLQDTWIFKSPPVSCLPLCPLYKLELIRQKSSLSFLSTQSDCFLLQSTETMKVG